MTISAKLTYLQLETFIQDYFQAVSTKDIEKLMLFYAENASFTVHAAPQKGDPTAWGSFIVFKSKQEIQKLYEQFFENTKKILLCRAEHSVIDEQQQRIATEQRYVAYNYADEQMSLYNCNFFDFNEEGKIYRVMNWSANEPY